MKIQLKKSLIEQVKITSQFQVKKLTLEGIELEEFLKYYLSEFTVGILDPDTAGKKPDRFVSNLQNGILGDFSNRYIITAYDNNDAIGILIGLPEAGQRLHIYSLHVSPEYRNKGVGSTLLSRCINDMCISNVKDIILDVHLDNKPAYTLYKKFDFI
ncbi:GNAT family N-acetyltransferase [Clostridium estertheticum]|uniref:GNAT family N-acetyltransferase n=1 Tax=Clostridium estertheticum TaxID=238834 RepID=UPI0013E99217|nr:GNAT family N-acetyltransferase [Clostridium estertheticum]MBZ9686542.1 GNAT family N-acetyltransferase [Clostridium estertheticum]